MFETSKVILTYLLTVPVFFAIDILWLGVVARSFYQKSIGHLMADSTNWPVAVIFYLFYIVGIMYFAVMPGVAQESVTKVLTNGAIFGAFAYGTYELTNLATLKNWPVTLTVVDIIWGIILTTLTALAAYFIFLWLQ